MSGFKGTPWPWRVEADTSIISDINGFICEAFGDGTSWQQDLHNANLIAAAPELLEALRQLRDYVDDTHPEDHYECESNHPMMLARSAIAKALGQ